jgi:RimJ/RimL family protein N-acetyltransferase
LNCDETEVLGCSRYYEINPEQKSVAIGYTFLIKKCWGKGYNQAVKDLMITHAFRYVEHIRFYVDSRNTRSQLAIARLGAEKISSVEEKSETGETNIKLIFQLERKSPVF